jgi:DNA-binding NarL/FixJ family response regulator
MRRFASGSEGEPGSQEILSDREHEVLVLAARGYKNKEIADRLFLSVRTVEAHLASIFLKLKVGSRTEAVMCGLRKGLLVLDDLNEGEGVGERPSTESH